MATDETPAEMPTKLPTLADRVKQFFLGIALGVVMLLIPLVYVSIAAIPLGPLYPILGLGVVLGCGILGAVFGHRFFAPVMQFLESIPPIA